MKLACTIAHVSDFHNITEDNDLVEKLLTFISSVKPNFIVVSGDLAEHPLFWQHLRSRDVLLKLAKEAGISDPYTNVILVPGNHDYGLWGNIGFSPLTGVSYRWAFREWPKKCIAVHKSMGIAFFLFDSNPYLTNFARGRVSHWQFRKFKKELSDYSRDEEFKSLLKIAVVHHHPSPIIYAGKLEGFLELTNASKFLRTLAERDVSLILHGHKHHASTSVLRLGLVEAGEKEHKFREVTVLSAGTTLKQECEGPPGNNLNIIKIYKNGRVAVEKAFACPGSNFVATQPRTVPSIDSFFDASLEKEQMRQCLLVYKTHKSLVLDEQGDGDVALRMEKVVVLPNNMTSIHHNLGVTSGSVQEVNVKSIKGSFTFDTEMVSHKEANVTIKFRPDQLPSEEAPATYEIVRQNMNAYAMSRLEFKRKYPDRNDWIEQTGCNIDRPTLGMSLHVQLPKTLRLQEPPSGFAKCLTTDLTADWLTKLVNNHLCYDERTNSISITIRKPPCGYQYGISWILPEVPHVAWEPKHVLEGKELTEKLRDIRCSRGKQDLSDRTARFLSRIAEQIKRDFEIREGQPLEVSIWYLDSTDAMPLLRQAVSTEPDQSPFWEYSFEVGDGNMGRAYKRNTLRFFVNLDGVHPPPAPYLLGKNRQGTEQAQTHRVLWSIPMRHPSNNDLILAVLNVGSFEAVTKLVPQKSTGMEVERKMAMLAASCLVQLCAIMGIELSLPPEPPSAT